LNYGEQIGQALLRQLEAEPKALILGEGVTDPKGIFGTCTPARDAFPERVIETPISETMLTGALVGLALDGWHPIYVHARAEFSLLGWSQMVDTLAKWEWLHGTPLPVTIRCIVGRGWGQGPTHSQSFHGMTARVPGLRTYVPVDPEQVGNIYAGMFRSLEPSISFESRRMYDKVGLGIKHHPNTYDVAIYTVGDIIFEGALAQEELLRNGVTAKVEPLQVIDPGMARPPAGCPVVLAGTSPGGLDMIYRFIKEDFSPVPIEVVEPPNVPLGTAKPYEDDYYPDVREIVNAAYRALNMDKAMAHPFGEFVGPVPDSTGVRAPF
jgi:acetoin:2,6-dichlorophenolindophenol oxidoreductase subunit beta